MYLNNRKMKNHPPSPKMWYQCTSVVPNTYELEQQERMKQEEGKQNLLGK